MASAVFSPQIIGAERKALFWSVVFSSREGDESLRAGLTSVLHSARLANGLALRDLDAELGLWIDL